MPIGVDIIEPPMMFELEKAGLKIKDGQQVMLSAREVKSSDEIALLNRAAAMVDGAYDLVNEMLRPGVRENDIVAEVNKFLYTHGSDDVEAVNAISGERCNPHPHNFTDRMIRPGDQAFFDILQAFMGYRTCYYRTFNVVPRHAGAARRLQEGARVARQRDRAHQARRLAPRISARCSRRRDEFGFPDEMSAFGLQFAHGLGLNLHERPIISRVVSMDHPTEIKEGMVFAIETYCPATDGFSAARIEEEVVVTDKGCTADLAVPGGGIADLGEVLTAELLFHLPVISSAHQGGDDGRRRQRRRGDSRRAHRRATRDHRGRRNSVRHRHDRRQSHDDAQGRSAENRQINGRRLVPSSLSRNLLAQVREFLAQQ